MEIRIRETGAIVTEQQFRAMMTNVSMPSVLTEASLAALGADPVLEGPQADLNTRYHFSQRGPVENVDGLWMRTYVVGPFFEDELDENGAVTKTAAEQEAEYRAGVDAKQAAAIRADRNRLMAESDWTQVDDTPLTNAKKLAWATYRQALRDITAQSGFPWEVVWPNQPE